ncbi:hypothetical protein SEA_GILDA_80 [Microbacterium phage Gilda]|uniref:Uncharacterized protein n=1 Tax=Microbacterium phage Gilda TaxID=2772024 RepID=A0A7L7STX4_9CAUD|nr:hypothetical protein SEA_GILDA_80 [Microbacterium phage Gilda]
MPTIDNPALLAIAQAKYTQNEKIEESREKLRHLDTEVRKAQTALENATVGRDRQAQHHAKLQVELNQLNDAERTLQRSLEPKEEAPVRPAPTRRPRDVEDDDEDDELLLDEEDEEL